MRQIIETNCITYFPTPAAPGAYHGHPDAGILSHNLFIFSAISLYSPGILTKFAIRYRRNRDNFQKSILRQALLRSRLVLF